MKDNRVTKIFIISLLLLFFLFGMLYLSRQIIVPFIVAGIICYVFSPIINKIMLLGVKRWVAVSFVVILILTIFIYVITLLVPVMATEIKSFTQNYQKYEMIIKKQCYDISKKIPFLKKYTDTITNTTEDSENSLMNLIASKLETLSKHITSVVSVIPFIILIPIITFFMLLGTNKAKESFIEFLPAKYVEFFVSFIYEVNFVLGGYIRGQIIEVFFIAIATSLILISFNIKYALIIGAVSGLFNIIPYLGPVVAMVSGVLATAIQYKSITLVLYVFIALEVMEQIDGRIIQPLIVGKNVNLGPVTMIFALLFGANIGGVLGMLIAVPTLAVLKNIFIIFTNRYRKSLLR